MSHQPSAANSPIRRKPGQAKPVYETFLNPINDDKFCLPCTLTTARQFELDIEKIKKDLKDLRKRRKKQDKKAMLAVKEIRSQIQVCAKRKFPHDMR